MSTISQQPALKIENEQMSKDSSKPSAFNTPVTKSNMNGSNNGSALNCNNEQTQLQTSDFSNNNNGSNLEPSSVFTTATLQGHQTNSTTNLSSGNTTGVLQTNNSSDSTSTITNTNNTNNQEDVCRDFLRNVCRRGKSCRYKHPDTNEVERSKEPFVFCHDYQNRECRRENCRFLHCTKQEEEIYRSTGKLPSYIQNDDRNSTPICKDYLNGTCRRGPRCKYRHQSMMESFHYSQSLRSVLPPAFDSRNGRLSNYSILNNNNNNNSNSNSNNNNSNSNSNNNNTNNNNNNNNNNTTTNNNNNNNMDYHGSGFNNNRQGSSMMALSNYGYNDNYQEKLTKRKRYDMYLENSGPYSGVYNDSPLASGNVRSGYGTGSIHQSPNQTYASGFNSRTQQTMDSRSFIEEENSALRVRINELKKQVSELISTNEYLLEQLNQIRASGPAVALTSVGNTSVSSLQPPPPAPGSVSSTAAVGMSTPITLQAQVAPPQAAAVAIGALPPVSIVSSIASISLPTVSAPVTLVNSSAAASLASFTPSMHSTSPWPLGVDQ